MQSKKKEQAWEAANGFSQITIVLAKGSSYEDLSLYVPCLEIYQKTAR